MLHRLLSFILARWMAYAASFLSALIAAFFIFFAAPRSWDFLEKILHDVNWKTFFLILFLVFYFAVGVEIWNDELRELNRLKTDGPLWKIPFKVLGGLFKPAIGVVGGIIDLSRFATYAILEGILHESARKIIARSMGVFALIWVSTFAILIFANLWQPKEHQCKWVFPKIMTCVLTSHDGLAGGVIGAGGTIFAGWLAWTAVQEQIALTRRNNSSNEQNPAEPPNEDRTGRKSPGRREES